MISYTKNSLYKHFHLRSCFLGEDAKHKVGPMKFNIEQYEIEGVGILSIMQGKAIVSLMKMDTIIIIPIYKDTPILSYDRIHAMGNDTCIVEIIDTLVNNEDSFYIQKRNTMNESISKYGKRLDHDLGKHWYDYLKLSCSFSKKGKQKDSKGFDAMYSALLNTYIELLVYAKTVDRSEKLVPTQFYMNGLFEHGGPSTDEFVKVLGLEKTKILFNNIIFGTKERS